jgi:hypothetical protein
VGTCLVNNHLVHFFFNLVKGMECHHDFLYIFHFNYELFNVVFNEIHYIVFHLSLCVNNKFLIYIIDFNHLHPKIKYG